MRSQKLHSARALAVSLKIELYPLYEVRPMVTVQYCSPPHVPKEEIIFFFLSTQLCRVELPALGNSYCAAFKAKMRH